MVPNPNGSQPARSHTLDTYDNPLAFPEVNKRWFSKALPQAAHWAVRIDSAGWERPKSLTGQRRCPSPLKCLPLDRPPSRRFLPLCGADFYFKSFLPGKIRVFFQIEHGLEAEVLRMAARAAASCRTDGPIDMKAPIGPVHQGLGRRALAHEGMGQATKPNPWGGIGGALEITPRPSC